MAAARAAMAASLSGRLLSSTNEALANRQPRAKTQWAFPARHGGAVSDERRARTKRVVGVNPDWGITVVRLMTGLLFAIHGYQKFAGGMTGVAAFFAKVAIPFPGVMAPFIAILELVGGVLLLLGVATRIVAGLFAIEMLVTTLWVKIPSTGWDASDLDRMLLVACVLFVLAGPGAAALDRFWWEREEAARG